ncbi:alpha/beta hydrolase family protein [Sphingosinicella rhizophila]|uniref:Peptidase S9 prolyl oligopeptidase catalytic domain-containing protein n=1 Tax=Sphingosinicella rhizophila TaxID=3050082 RepID=A0ABU3Q9M1_9SPHN|nr:hypothetical protein [Sphingosinicella sp. GR2756]MDT9600108.1 hypothetical protein [Sphingosinicella sp. GR2756]
MRGDLNSGKRETTLWLFETASAREFLKGPSRDRFNGGRPLIRFASGANREPISDWRWTSDSRALLFLGAADDGARRLYRVDTSAGEPVPLSKPNQDVSRYDEAKGSIVYLAHPSISEETLYQAGGTSLPDIEIGTGKSILPLLFPNWLEVAFDTSSGALWRVDEGEALPVLDVDTRAAVQLKDSKLALSPDGKRLIVTKFVPLIPGSWESYRPLIEGPASRFVADTEETKGGTGRFRPKRYVLIDLQSGSQRVLLDAPIEIGVSLSAISPRWSADGTWLALPGAYPPIERNAAAARASILPCEIMVMEVRQKDFFCAKAPELSRMSRSYGDREQLISLEWRTDRGEFFAYYSAPNDPNSNRAVILSKRGAGWGSGPSEMEAQDMAIAVEEALDEPPVLIGRIGGSAKLLLDPNPQLRNIALGKAELYHWRDRDGDAWSGALVTPPGFDPGTRYPLVIQTHNLDRAKFLVDGPSATGFAARALAGRGIVVLQVDEIRKDWGTHEESSTGAAGYRAAIDQLARDGVVDPAKVGIIAWSHMGSYALQGLIDEPNGYAAATLAESTYMSFGEYLMNIDYMGVEREKMFSEQMGAKPFGEGLKLWLERSPGFHTEHVCAPVLFQFNSPVALVYGWDMYAALRAQNKPVEMLYLRGGDHVLVKPLQRLAEQGMNVDWYDYWLNGHEDPDPAKADQYRRWDRMKAKPRCTAAEDGASNVP